MAAFVLGASAPAVGWAQTSMAGSLQLTQDYVSRGLSQTCGDPAAQADLHVRRVDPPRSVTGFAGVWGSAGLGRSACGSSREVDFYAGGSLVSTNGENVTLSYIHYSFPGGAYVVPAARGERYDYDELDAIWAFRDRVALSVRWTPDALSAGYHGWEEDRHGLSYGLELRQPIVWRLILSASAGYDRIVDPAGTGYGFWSLGVSRSWGPWRVDLAFFRASPRAVRVFGDPVAGPRVAASASWQF